MVGGYSEPFDYELLTSDEVTEVANFALSEFLLLAAASSSEGTCCRMRSRISSRRRSPREEGGRMTCVSGFWKHDGR
jgi:hypothetical protein